MTRYKHTISDIHRLIENLRDFTPYTLQPYTNEITKDLKASLQSPARYIKKLAAAEVIRPIKVVPQIYVNDRRFHFYTTKNTKNQEISYKEMEHRSMVADIALAFNYRFPGCDLSYEENVPVTGATDIRADLVVRHGKFVFVVELERSLTPLQIYETKIKRYEKMTRTGEFKNSKVLFVFAPRSWAFNWRPLEYPKLTREIEKMNKGVLDLIGQMNGCNNYYLAMAFKDFIKIDQSVWYRPGGQRFKLIN